MAALLRKLVTTPAPDDDADVQVSECTPKQEHFARVLADTGNKAAAYRAAYNVHENTSPNVVWVNASRLAALPHVRARTQEIQTQLVLETICTAREALAWQLDIATADPNEIAYKAKRSCRHCHGVGHAYQWVDDDEYIKACIKALDEKSDPPSDAGGYGYTRAPKPATDCPHCLGQGFEETVTNDTRELSGKARKLYKGIDYKNGEWVVTTHDQAKAWENVCRILGAFNDKLDLRTPADRKNATKLPEGLSEADAARAYLTLMG